MSNEKFQTFLMEVGVEEIPSQYVAGLAQGLSEAMQRALSEDRLAYRNVLAQYTPRRLIFQADVAPGQAAEVEMVRGPAVSVAYREGAPSPALEGFLRRVDLTEDQLVRQVVGGKEYLVAPVQKPVESASVRLPQLAAHVLDTLPQPRSMRWNAGDDRFIRPVRWLLMLLDDEVLPGSALGVTASAITYGNRTDHPEALSVSRAAAYWSVLQEGMVMADAEERRRAIVEAGDRLARDAGGRVDWDAELLDEVTNLVEWPTPFLGRFDEDFLEVPEPILITSMRVHQRYFPVRGQDGRLMAAFLAVRNGAGEALDQVRRGNQKVLRARLSDARYFFQLDRRHALLDHREALESVTLHAKLGTYGDKIERVKRLFETTREWWPLSAAEASQLERSLELYKCDLVTQVVSEFPELQGEMGAIYAALDHESAAVVEAIRDQYRPGFPGDRVPQAPVAQLLGLLDRADTLMAFYGANIRATGSEDPFGLRRVALGLARIAAETPILGERTVRELLAEAASVTGASPAVTEAVYQLVTARLISQWEEKWSFAFLNATLARDFSWSRLEDRLRFLEEHHGSRQFDDVVTAYKRVERIGRESGDVTLADTYTGVEADLKSAADAALAAPGGDLAGWWEALDRLLPAIAQFFEDVLVMDPDLAVRSQRLGLLARVQSALGRYYAWDQI